MTSPNAENSTIHSFSVLNVMDYRGICLIRIRTHTLSFIAFFDFIFSHLERILEPMKGLSSGTYSLRDELTVGISLSVLTVTRCSHPCSDGLKTAC